MQMTSSSTATGAGAGGSVAPSDPGTTNHNWPGCFRHVARCRRLNKEEVVLILSNPLKFGLVRTEVLPPEGITSGTVYLCSKDRVRVLKHDGIDYVKRNAAQGSNRIREDVVKMKVNGRHAVNSYSSRGSGSACFWRRRYALEPPAPANGVSGSRGRGQQNVAWGDQLVHYLDDEEARGFARRSPFGAAGVARPLTSEECWRGRGAQLPPDGNLFLAPSRREARRDEPMPLPSPTADKVLPSLAASVKQEQTALRAGSGPGNGSGGSSSHTAGGGWGGSIVKAQGARRYAAQPDVRGIVPGLWGSAEMYGMSSNGNIGEGALVGMGSPGNRLGGVTGAGITSGGAPVWDSKKGAEAQQSSGLNNPTGFYDELGGLEFEGLGMNDVTGAANASADDDMSDLFRSFLVDGDDMLATSGGSGGHSGSSGVNHSSGSQTGGATVELAQPSGFGLRVGNNSSAGVRVAAGQDADAVGPSLIRRRANTSPELEETGTGGGAGGLSATQRSSIVMLPKLVGSPLRRAETLSCGDNSSSMQTDEEETTTMENDATPLSFASSRGRGGNTAGGVTVAAAAAAAAATVAHSESCAPPTSLQLGSSWSDSYPISSGKATTSSTSPVAREVGSTAVHAAPSPAGSVPGLSGVGGGAGGVTIVDFSPTWDFAPGGAKLLICLAAPIDADPGSVGPIIFFADRAVQSEVVSHTVLRCRVPPGPGLEGTSRVPIRVEAGHGHGRLDQVGSSCSDRLGGVRKTGVSGVHFFEYRSPAASPSSVTSALSRGGTPRVLTPAKRLAWQEQSEDGKTSSTPATRKREWGEVVTSSAPPPALEAVYSSPVSCNWVDRGRVWGTPRASESSPWGMRTICRSSSASNGRRGQPQMWRRASGDFGSLGLAESGGQVEESVGYPPAACDGRECKIRIVERPDEISDPRAHGAGAQRVHDGSDAAGGTRTLTVASPCRSAAATSGLGAQGSWGDPGACCTDVHQSTLSSSTRRIGDVSSACSSVSCVSTSVDTGEGAKGLVVGQRGGVIRAGSSGRLVAARGGNDLGQHQALDDTALNELGDAELEVLLEQMWMKVMGQLTDLESELNALDARGFSVLHYTCLHSLSELVPVLLERGADVNLRTADGRDQTPLHLAAIGGNLRIVQELMERGADMTAVDGLGLTPDKLAMHCNKREVGLYLWGQTRGTGARGGGGQSSGIASSSSNGGSTRSCHASSGTASTRTPTPSSTPHVRQGSPAALTWGGGVSPAECPTPLWCDPASGSGADNWQGQLSPSPETPNERLSVGGGTPTPSALGGGVGDGGSLSDGGNPASPATAPVPSAAGTTPGSSTGLDGSSASSGVVTEPGSFIGQVNVSWIGSTPRTSGNNTGRALEGKDIMGGNGGGAREGGGPWGLGLPPPGGTDKGAAVDVRASTSTSPAAERLDLVSTIDEEGSVDSDDAGREQESELEHAKKSSTEEFLAEATSTLSLHEKCALHLYVSSLQQQENQRQQRQQQQRQQQRKEGHVITGGETGGDTSGRKDSESKACLGVDLSKLSSVSSVLTNDESGLRATDMQTIIEMMGPQDLSELEEEVKVIKNDVRAWILRCNYKSLRKALRTLQTVWRGRRKNREPENASGGSGTGDPPASPLSISGRRSRSSSGFALGSGSEPMDDGCGGGNGSVVTSDLSGADTPPPLSDSGGSGVASDGGGGGGVGNNSNPGAIVCVGSGRVSLDLGLEEERSRREDRAAKALQTASRVMLARRGRFQRLARETSALLVIQKRSREWLRQKQNNW